MKNRIQIFRAGRQTTAAGQVIEFDEGDLVACAAAYDPATHEAPIVVGHPATDAPAYGWVKGLSVEDGVLTAEVDQIAPEFAEAVKAGAYKHRSAAFYAPTNPQNPKPGAYYLRHVGFLGAQPPSVKGLAPVEFAAGDADVEIEFDEAAPEPVPAPGPAAPENPPTPAGKVPEQGAPVPAPSPQVPLAPENARDAGPGDGRPLSEASPDPASDLAARMAELEAKAKALEAREAALVKAEAEQKHAEVASFAEGLVKDGRLLPRDRAGIVEFLLAMPEAPIEFAEGEGTRRVDPGTWLREFLGRLPRQIEFRELSRPAGVDFGDPRAIAEAAQKLQAEEAGRGNHISAAAAVRRITGGAAQ